MRSALRRRGERLIRRLSGRDLRSALRLSQADFLGLFRLDGRAPDWPALDAHFARRAGRERLAFPERISRAASRPRAELLRRADQLCADTFEHGAQPPVRFEGGVDWGFDPTPDPRKRWARELHRHQWLPVLALAYEHTGNERYAEQFVALIDSWIEHNPPPPLMDEGHLSWNLMNAGMRCVTWPIALLRFYPAPAFRPEHKQRMLRSIHDHARFLYLFKTHDNHLLRESNGLASIAGWLPEFAAAPRWRDRALERLATEVARQINADGSHIEMSIAYQWLAMEELEATLDLVERWGWAFPGGRLHQALERGYRMLAATRREDGQWPQLNDGFFAAWDVHQARLEAAAARFGFAGELPRLASTSAVFPDAGLAIMRDGQGNSLLFKAGPFGGLHGHDDKLGIEVVAHGRPIIVDPGTYTYNTDDPLRAHLVSSHAHSTVLVDDASQIRRWLPQHRRPRPAGAAAIAWRGDDDVELASGLYGEGYAPFRYQPPQDWPQRIEASVTHRRSVVFVRGGYWILIDDLHGAGAHDYARLFQAAADVEVTHHDGAAVLTHPGGGGVMLAAGEPDAAWRCRQGVEHPPAGWVSNGGRGGLAAAPMLSLHTRRSGHARLLTLLAPFAAGRRPPGIGLQARMGAEESESVLDVRLGDRQEQLVVRLSGPADADPGSWVSGVSISRRVVAAG